LVFCGLTFGISGADRKPFDKVAAASGAGCEERQAVAEAGPPDLGSYRPRLTMTPGGAAALPRHCETG